MWTRSDDSQTFTPQRSGLRSARRLVLAFGVVFAAGVPGLMGTMGTANAAPFPQSADRPPATAQEKSDLRAAIEARYEVLPITGGVLLKPRQAKAGVHTIEVAGDRIAINGEPVVSARTLRDWLGADADVLLRLQAVPAAGRRQLLGLDAEPAGRPTAAQPATKEAPPAATSDTDTAATDAAETSDTTEEPSMAEPPAPPEPAEEAVPSKDRHSSGRRVNVGGSVHVAKDELADQVVAIGGAADVQGDVNHEVTAVGGPARIEGKVGGDVVSIGSNVYLGPHSVVSGDVTSVGGTIERDPGAVIRGSTSEVGMMPFGRHRHFLHYGPTWGFWGGVSDLMGSLVRLVLSGLLVCLVLMVARRPLERVDRMLVTQAWPSVAVGLAGSIFFWPLFIVVTILLAITIIGCVLFLLYPFLLLYVGLLLILGYATVSYRLGLFLVGRLGLKIAGDYAAALTGVVALQGWIVLGNLFDLLPWPFGFFAFICWLFGTLATIAALVTGFGAVILSRFGLAPGYWPGRGAPPPAYAVPVMPPPPYSPPPAEGLPLTDPAAHPPEEPR
jgi:hypothetical protein